MKYIIYFQTRILAGMNVSNFSKLYKIIMRKCSLYKTTPSPKFTCTVKHVFQMGSVAIMARVYVINMTCVSQLVQ